MQWLDILAKLLPIIFGVVPALQSHAKTAADAVAATADAVAIGSATQSTVKGAVLSTVLAGIAAANDELVAASKAPLDSQAIASAASSAIDTAIAVTNLVHATHGTGAAPAPATT